MLKSDSHKFVIFDLDGMLIDSYELVMHCIECSFNELNCTIPQSWDVHESMSIHEILKKTEDLLKKNRISQKKFYGIFDSFQSKIFRCRPANNKYFPKVIARGHSLVMSYMELGYTIVLLTNFRHDIAETIVKRLFKDVDLILIGRENACGTRKFSATILSRLRKHKISLDECVAFYGISSENVSFVKECGWKNFKLTHDCSNIQLKSFSDSELGIGLSYITALFQVFNHLSSSSITNPKYIFRGVTQRFFTSSSVLSSEIQKFCDSGKSNYKTLDKICDSYKLSELKDEQGKVDLQKVYNLLSSYVKKQINEDIIHTNGDSDLYAKYIISLITEEQYLHELLSPQYLRSGAGVRLNKPDSVYRQQDYLWYIRNLIIEGQRLYPKEVKDKDLDILADLQHMGAGTCLLDFSRNFLVALWFATQDFDREDKKETGYLFCYDIVRDAILDDSIEITNKNSIFLNRIEWALNLTKKSVKYNGDATYKFLVWTPDNINNRIIRQDSVFLFGIEPFKLSEHKVLKIPIPYAWKRYIQMALKSFFGVSSESLYADVAGYATSNEKLQSLSIKTSYFNDKFFYASMNNADMENFDLFQKGTGCLMKGEYEHALDYFLAFEAVNRAVIRNIEAGKQETETGKQLTIQLYILCIELFYSKGICNKHMENHKEIAISFYEKAQSLIGKQLSLYSGEEDLYKQNYLNDTIELSLADYLTYLENKLYKILDSYIGLLIDVKYFKQAYRCLEGIVVMIDKKQINYSNTLLLNTAQNEIVTLSHLYDNTDTIWQCPCKHIPSENQDLFKNYPFIELLNSFFELLISLCAEKKEIRYERYYSSLLRQYNRLESDYFIIMAL